MDTTETPRTLINVRQIAKRFKIGPHQVQMAIGGLPYFSYGKAKLYLIDDVDRAIQAWRACLPARLSEARVKALESYKKTIAARRHPASNSPKPDWRAIRVSK